MPLEDMQLCSLPKPHDSTTLAKGEISRALQINWRRRMKWSGTIRKLLFSVALFAQVVSGDRTSCQISKAIEGQPATVACHFTEVALGKKHTLKLLRHDSERPWTGPTPEMILKCDWKPNSVAPSCTTNPGYEHSISSRNTVTVNIPRVTQSHAGFYVCTDSTKDGRHDDAVCRLYVRGAYIRCEASTVAVGSPGRITCHFNSDLSETRDGFLIYRTVGFKKTDKIFSCSWDGRDKLSTICTSCSESFQCHQEIPTRTVSVYIPSVHQDHTGRYFCDTVPSHITVTTEPCFLNITGKSAAGLSTTAQPTVSTTHVSSETTHMSEAEPSGPPIKVLIPAIVIGVCVVIIVGWIGYKRRQSCNGPENNQRRND